MQSGKFNFTYLPKKELHFFQKKSNLDLLLKWSMKDNLKVKCYNFNEKFLPYQKQEFVESFFTDPNVLDTMEVMESKKWYTLKKPATKVTVQQIPCSVTSMEFFDKITNEKNSIVRKGRILECMEEQIDGFYVNDHLISLLLDPNSEFYRLYCSAERQQFLFLLLMHLVLGGSYCQHEFDIDPYLDAVKQLYKELLSVQRAENRDEIEIRSLVLKVVAYGGENDEPICPTDPGNKQNFVYLIIDDFKRQVTVFMHQYGPVFFL